MTQYNTLNVKLFNSQLNKIFNKNETEVTLNLSSNLIRNSNDETNFPRKLLLTNIQVSKICKASEMAYQLMEYFQKLSCLKMYN